MTRFTPFACVTAIVFAISTHAQSPRDVRIETVKVTENIYMLVGPGAGNIGLCVGADGAFMIDDQFATSTGPILEAVAAITDQPVRFLINTHRHGDHTGGNQNLAGEGAVIVAHENVRKRMSVEQVSTVFGTTTPPAPRAALAVITFTEAMTFHFNREEIHAVHAPHAHTDGDTIIHFVTSNVVHMGDAFFSGMYPYLDVDSGGGIEGAIRAADAVLARCDDDTRIIPGHGPLCGPKELRAYRDMLTKVRDAVVRALDEGLSREAILEAKLTAAFDAHWGDGLVDPDLFIRLVYDSLVEIRP